MTEKNLPVVVPFEIYAATSTNAGYARRRRSGENYCANDKREGY